MFIQKLAWVFAIVFLTIGILGFIPSIIANGQLLGIFEVDTLHNIIHLASGILAAVAASMSVTASRLYFQVFGGIYALVAGVGFLQGDTVLNLIGVNLADNVLHVVIAATALYIGFAMRENNAEEARQTEPAPEAGPGPGEPMV